MAIDGRKNLIQSTTQSRAVLKIERWPVTVAEIDAFLTEARRLGARDGSPIDMDEVSGATVTMSWQSENYGKGI